MLGNSEAPNSHIARAMKALYILATHNRYRKQLLYEFSKVRTKIEEENSLPRRPQRKVPGFRALP